ncbi:FAD-binding oxidoreductase [Chondromyces apiculatus]|uniref:Glycolate dehydrogenase n=1 Tax=Chondromyces apiculatus DSM 436 TaxID=1192034 RepID=A0A017TCE0_9BACT|nr:FAD-linked oxidase C-terminal domain-containing protein [Chondromyces apiculatus]EYF06953.1 Glycolate dehydrogenase [Chondromyces apiculatus DSM 436]
MRLHPSFPRPSAAMADKARSLLERALGPSKVLTSPEACLAYAGDESDQEPVAPDAVVLASSAEDIAKAMRAASEAEVPIVPRAGGSGKSGGCVPVAGGVVIATLGMNGILEISREEQVAVVQPGVILADLHAAVEAEGMFFPPDPNSLKMCAIGGNIAENAAGPRAFKYGSTRDYVLGLEVVLIDGTRLRTGKRTVKGVTGYDVTSLLVGSEGTLAVTTEATLRLIPNPGAVMTLMALFPDVYASGRAVSAMIAAGVRPRCIELLDEGTLDAVRARGVAVDARARAMLILEVDGAPADCEAQAERLGEVCAVDAIDILVAQDAAQRDRLWEARRQLSPATRAMARYKLSEDVVVPRDRIPALLEETRAIEAETGIRMITYGHAGDGNLHVNLLWNDAAMAPLVERSLHRLFRAVVSMRGTLTGEHGVGTSKADFLGLEQQPELIELQKQIKRVFDPKGLLNPHKIFPRRQLEAAPSVVDGRAVALHGAC